MGKENKNQAQQAANRSIQLMNEYGAIGRTGLTGVIDYASRGLDQGLPGYVDRAYRGAGTAALEQTLTDSTAARRGLSHAPGEALGTYVPAVAGAAGALARSQAGLELSRTGAAISQRNQLLRTLTGQGASSVNLAAGFGGLQNRALAAGLGGGDPTYEAIVGGGSFASALIAKLMEQHPDQSGILGFNPNAQGGFNSSLGAYQGGGGTVDLTGRP